MLPEANEVCMARREAHEPLLVLDHRVEEVADGEVPAVRRPEDLSRTIIAGEGSQYYSTENAFLGHIQKAKRKQVFRLTARRFSKPVSPHK